MAGLILAAIIALIAALASPATAQDLRMPINPIWGVPDIGALPDDAHGRLVRRGRDLITATHAHIGPDSFNDGADMDWLIATANFTHFNEMSYDQ